MYIYPNKISIEAIKLIVCYITYITTIIYAAYITNIIYIISITNVTCITNITYHIAKIFGELGLQKVWQKIFGKFKSICILI